MSGAPTDHWMQFYNHTNALSSAVGSAVADVTTPNQSQSQTHATSLSPDSGRVTKPARKRSRASRRTPTTLLNTDKSNFRAMVQQFTGGPAFASGPNNLMGFGLGLARPPGPAGGYQVHYTPQQPHQQQQQQQLQYHHHDQSYSSGMAYSGSGQDAGGLIQRLMMEGQGGDGPSVTARPGTGVSNENTNYLF